MGDRHSTCISSFSHEASDVVLHYFGCLRENEREEFLVTLSIQDRVRVEQEKVRSRILRAKLERDDDKKFLVLELKESLSLWRGHRYRTANVSNDSENGHSGVGTIHATMMFWKDTKPLPKQMILVNDLLDSSNHENPLLTLCEDSMVRYFHFPANNIHWAEKAISLYLKEKPPGHDRSSSAGFWPGQGQRHNFDATLSRHITPHCGVMASTAKSWGQPLGSIALYMPYLHWEVERRTARLQRYMKKVEQEYHQKMEQKRKEDLLNGLRQSLTVPGFLHEDIREKRNRKIEMLRGDLRKSMESPPPKPIRTLTEVVAQELGGSQLPSRFKRNSPTSLGKIFIQAARLAEAIGFYEDEELINAFLMNDPPLHPRRTLEQSNANLGLKVDRQRQVVYRAVAGKPLLPHYHEYETACEQCFEESTRIPRVIMVDQLWLWILDSHTLISCFPKRYGRDTNDESSVIDSIQRSVQAASQQKITTAYDLGLLIVDQCSKVFFDSVRIAAHRPLVIDTFKKELETITKKQTIAYNRVWGYIDIASKMARKPGGTQSMANIHNWLDDINLEGRLLQEINDVLDELHSMLYITTTQQIVLNEFMKRLLLVLPSSSTQESPRQGEETLGKGENDQSYITKREQDSNKQIVNKDRDRIMEFGQTVVANLAGRESVLTNMKDQGERIQRASENLLALKQQLAGVDLALQAVKQTDETIRQGRSIMLFTVVTIIFLPLSFFSSLFAMNTAEFSSWDIRRELSYMLPISLAVILVSFLFAFSLSARSFGALVWAVISFLLSVSWTFFITKTGLFSIWEEFPFTVEEVTDRKEFLLRVMEEKARRQMVRKRNLKNAREREGEV